MVDDPATTALGLELLSPRQRELIRSWLPDVEIEADLSWGLVETAVLRARVAAQVVVIKGGGESDHHIAREIRAHQEWNEPWTAHGRAARMLHCDVAAKLLVTEYLPGRLVQGDSAAAEPDTYLQAGELLRAYHSQLAVEDADYEARANVKALSWLSGPHRIAPEIAGELRATVQSWRPVATVCVPTHGDWHGRNWLIDDDGVVRVIDFGRADLRAAAEDLERLAVGEFKQYPGAEEAFLAGYGSDPREPDTWFRQRVRSAVATACWAYRVGDEKFEAQGHQMIADILPELG